MFERVDTNHVLQRTTSHCNALATHCNTLQHTATCLSVLMQMMFFHMYDGLGGNTLQHTATHCNTLQHTATHRNKLQHTATHRKTCNTLQHITHAKIQSTRTRRQLWRKWIWIRTDAIPAAQLSALYSAIQVCIVVCCIMLRRVAVCIHQPFTQPYRCAL